MPHSATSDQFLIHSPVARLFNSAGSVARTTGEPRRQKTEAAFAVDERPVPCSTPEQRAHMLLHCCVIYIDEASPCAIPIVPSLRP